MLLRCRTASSHALMLLATAAIAGVLLSAVQIVPALALTRASERASFHYPRNVFEIRGYASRPVEHETGSLDKTTICRGRAVERLFGKPPRGTHHEQLYDFSVAPVAGRGMSVA